MILRINIQNRQLPAENESAPRDYLSLGWSRGFLLRGKLRGVLCKTPGIWKEYSSIALEIALKGHSVLLTGFPGTDKSCAICQIAKTTK